MFAALVCAFLAAMLLTLASDSVSASCGQSSCAVDADLAADVALLFREVRLGSDVEYIDQDQPWVSSGSASVGELPAPHAEVETTNVSWKLNAEVGISDNWSLSLLAPLVYREHFHLDPISSETEPDGGGAHHGEEPPEEPDGVITIGDATGTPERWSFFRFGDMQLAAHYNYVIGPASRVSAYVGLKLPTGDTNVRNDDGEEAEMTLQPGTGSVDPLIGGSVTHRFTIADRQFPSLLSASVRIPGSDGRFGYRAGADAVISAGTAYAFVPRLTGLLQLNFRHRDRDDAGNAPGVADENTGGEYLFISPGVKLGIADGLALLTYVQVPVFQRVNGIQIVSRWNLLCGLTYSFGL